MNLNCVHFVVFAAGSIVFLGCAPHAESEQRAVTATAIETASEEEPPVGSRARDRSVWIQLLSDHAKIRRTVVHREEAEVVRQLKGGESCASG